MIKVEPPEGDPARNFGRMLGGDLPVNPVFELDNRGKRAIALDLSDERGVDLARRLVAGADVFLTNLRPAALGRVGLGPDETCAAAHEIDLAISHRTVDEICRAQQHPAECPHGAPILPCRHPTSGKAA